MAIPRFSDLPQVTLKYVTAFTGVCFGFTARHQGRAVGADLRSPRVTTHQAKGAEL